MKIGLFGFTMAHENMGCQALTCSFLELIREICREKKITIVCFGNEHTLGLIPSLFSEFKFVLENVRLKGGFRKFIHSVSDCDFVFDITAGDGFSDIYFTKGTYRDTLIKILCTFQKNVFILAPQTYGPFSHKSLEWLAGIAVKRSDYAYARDEISAIYVKKISGREVPSYTDIAFILPFDRQKFLSDRTKIGFNVSGLLWKGGFSETNQFGLVTDYREYCRGFMRKALNAGYEVHLISHVTRSEDANRVILDGDYPACQILSKEFPDVILSPCFATPYEAKNYISGMDFFVGARMHATIGAFSSGVVTIPFAYSRKFRGLYEKIGYSYFIDGKILTTKDAIQMTFNYLAMSDNLKKVATKSMDKVNRNIDSFKQELSNLFGEGRSSRYREE